MDLTAEAETPGRFWRCCMALGTMAIVVVALGAEKFGAALPSASAREPHPAGAIVRPTRSKPTRVARPLMRDAAATPDDSAPTESSPSDCKHQLEPARSEYLKSFAASALFSGTLYSGPTLPESTRISLIPIMEQLPRRAMFRLGLSSPAPAIYLYPSVAALQKFSCAHDTAVAYYDGSIHLAPLASERETGAGLSHEYAHHVLMSNDIHGPFWFQEGAALEFAGDFPGDYLERARKAPLVPSEMVEGLPKAISLERATTFYAQAYAMLKFLEQLCGSSEPCGSRALAKALIADQTTPSTLFQWALIQWGGARTARWRELWGEYVTTGTLNPRQ